MAAKMIWAWGNNGNGQIGNNSTDHQSSPVSIARSSTYKITSIGNAHSLAIDAATDMVWAWGYNATGQLGNNAAGDQSSPVSIARAGSYNALVAGYNHNLAIDAATGMVWAWGNNGQGQLGTGNQTNQSSPVSIARIGSYKAIAANGSSNNYSQSLAIDAATGMVWAWGQNYDGRLGDNTVFDRSSPVSIARAGSYSAIAVGDSHCLAIDAATGMVWAWGYGSYGRLGNNLASSRSSPVSIARAGSYSAIASGSYGGNAHSLAIDAATGMVWAWGRNNDGQLGNNDTASQSSPVSIVRAGSYSAISAGGKFSLAIDAVTGMVWAWGNNDEGRLGNDATAAQSSPVSIASTKKFSKISAGVTTSLGIEKAGATSAFNQPTVSDGASVTSTVDPAGLVDAIQASGTDTYFDTQAEVARVDVYYRHQDGRQQVRLPHKAPSFTAGASWTSYTRDGTWAKSRVRAFDWEGATVTLDGTNVPSGENLTHSGGVMNLNT